MIPEKAPRDADIDFGFLARQFELSGGEIRNVVLDAAFRAARDGAPISFRHLLRAVARQYAKRGHVLSTANLREHCALVSDEPAPAAPARAGPEPGRAGKSPARADSTTADV
jgi:hypothetical protein